MTGGTDRLVAIPAASRALEKCASVLDEVLRHCMTFRLQLRLYHFVFKGGVFLLQIFIICSDRLKLRFEQRNMLAQGSGALCPPNSWDDVAKKRE